MKLEGKFDYKKALILTPNRIQELESIFLKYCTSVSYDATTVADTEISFSSFDELLNYDNFQDRKIKELTVTGRQGRDRVVSCLFGTVGFTLLWGYDETCICRYSVLTVDIETTIRSDILTFLKKITAPAWIAGKFRFFGLLGCISLYAAPFLLFFGKNTVKDIDATSAIICILCSYCLIKSLKLIDKHILAKFFPPVVFLWGEEQVQYEKYDKTRKNIFWCVIVAIIVGIIVFYITNKLPQ